MTRDALTRTVLIGVLISSLAGRLCYLVERFDGDSAMFIYMGRVVRAGGVIGRDVIDNKLPTVGLIMAPIDRAFGLDWTAYVLLGAAMSIGGALLLAHTAKRYFGERATLPALLFALVYLNFSYAVYAGFQLETMQSFFAIVAASAALNALQSSRVRDAFVVGLFAGFAAMLKPSGLSVLGAFVIAVLIDSRARPIRDNLKLAIAASCGAALIALCVFAYLSAENAIPETVDLFRQINRYAQNSVSDRGDILKLLTVASLAAMPIFIRIWVQRRDYGPGVRRTRATRDFIFSWLLLEFAGATIQGRMYAYHFLVLAPPLTLLFAMIERRDRPMATVAALVPTLLLSLWGAIHVIADSRGGKWPARLAVSDYLAAHALNDDAVWKDDAPRLWLETGLRPASAIPMTFLFANDDGAPARFSSRLLIDFDRTKPTYIVLPADRERFVSMQGESILELSRNARRREDTARAWRRIFDYVDERYETEARVGSEVVYRRTYR